MNSDKSKQFIAFLVVPSFVLLAAVLTAAAAGKINVLVYEILTGFKPEAASLRARSPRVYLLLCP